MNPLDILHMNKRDKDNRDPFCFGTDNVGQIIRSFSTEQPMHPYLETYLFSQSPKEGLYHHMGTSLRGQDVGPIFDAMLGIHIFMGGINSRTGFTSSENNFCILAPLVLFRGKQKFSCRFLSYPSFTLAPATVRSDAVKLPAESFSVEFSVDMFAVKISLEPETNLVCTPEARMIEYNFRKEQAERSIDQTMQEHITHALANCPTMTMWRLRTETPKLDSLLSCVDTVHEFVYGEIQRQVNEFCSWSLDPVSLEGALQDAYESLMIENRSGSRPNCIVTTPEIADAIATVQNVQFEPTDVLYTVKTASEQDEFMAGDIRPYEGVSKKVSLTTKGITVAGQLLPILHVPHLSRESKSRYNVFEHGESFWCFNEVGFLSQGSFNVNDYRSVDRTTIRVTDLHKGEDGSFSMRDCQKYGGGLLPQTYNRFRYEELLRRNCGLLQLLVRETDETGLIERIGKALPPNSLYNFYFPSPKVRLRLGEEEGCHFRSAGIFGNRPSFDNWHPPKGDIEAAKDWMAKKFRLNVDVLEQMYIYLKKCSEIPWEQKDVDLMNRLNADHPKGKDLGQSIKETNTRELVHDLIHNKGYSKFVGMPRYLDALATLAMHLIQNPMELAEIAGVDPNDMLVIRTMGNDLQRIVNLRANLFACSRKLWHTGLKVDLKDGVLTDCPPSMPIYDIPPNVRYALDQSDECDNESRTAYRFYLLCIAPLVFKHVYTSKEDLEVTNSPSVDYRFTNPEWSHTPDRRKEEYFRQPYYRNGFLTSVPVSIPQDSSAVEEVSAYDPLYTFDLDVLRDDAFKCSRNNNFFDHFVSHRYQYLRDTEDEPFAVKVVAAFLNMMRYVPNVEKHVGHECLMNRKYRIVRQCSLQVGMVGVYRGGKENMMYAVGNMSTVTKQTAHNGIEIVQRVQGNCFIVDPLSAGRVLPNSVSKGLNSGMTSTLANVHGHVEGKTRLPDKWWTNMAYVVEGLPGTHPLNDQHHFLPLNGRHTQENLNVSGFDLSKLDHVGPCTGGWYAENMYSLRGYSEAHIVFNILMQGHHLTLPLYDERSENRGLAYMHRKSTCERKEMAGKIVERVDLENPVFTAFSGCSNIGFLEKQRYNCLDATSRFASETWMSKSPLKQHSCSDHRFVETLYLNHRRTDKGLKVLDAGGYQYNELSAPFRTGVKGRYTTEQTK